jgi:hypothetical protein
MILTNTVNNIIEKFKKLYYKKEYKRLINIFELLNDILVEDDDYIFFKNGNLSIDIIHYKHGYSEFYIYCKNKSVEYNQHYFDRLIMDDKLFKFIIDNKIYKLDLELIIEEYILEKI